MAEPNDPDQSRRLALQDQQRDRYPASVAEILQAQEDGYQSFINDPDGTCPYGTETPRMEFLRLMWVRGRAHARVNAMDAAGMFDNPTT